MCVLAMIQQRAQSARGNPLSQHSILLIQSIPFNSIFVGRRNIIELTDLSNYPVLIQSEIGPIQCIKINIPQSTVHLRENYM